MGYLEGGPHHPPPINPTGHGGAVPTRRTLGMRVIPVAPLKMHTVPARIRESWECLAPLERSLGTPAPEPPRRAGRGHNVTHRKGFKEWTGTSKHSAGRAIPQGSMCLQGYGPGVRVGTVTGGWSASES